MDGTGQVIRRQIEYIDKAGYDISCVYIPINDRSTWSELVADLLPLLRQEASLPPSSVNGTIHTGATSPQKRHVTLLAESFGTCLALRAAAAMPDVISRLVLVNPATGFSQNNPLVSLAARTGLLASFPDPLYEMAQDIVLPLLVKRNRVTSMLEEDMLSPVDYVPAPCASWRLSLLNDESGLEENQLSKIKTPTLLVASAKDRVLSALTETARLQKILPVVYRTLLPESGHTVFLEDAINIITIMEENGFTTPPSSSPPPEEEEEREPSVLEVLSRERKNPILDERLEEMGRILEPWRILTSPLISGVENLPSRRKKPERGVLFVGNHTLFGLYDSPLLVHELYLRGFRCRGLAHPGHWLTGVGDLMERYGNVKASPKAAYKLLKEGEDVLLFPGGAREVCKRKGEEYQLQWKEKADFVRMASRLGATIVPFGALGGDDAFRLLLDSEELLSGPVGPTLRFLYSSLQLRAEESLQPITALPGTMIPSLVPIPSIERIYFRFGEAVDTTEYNCDIRDPEQCQTLYELVRTRVENCIEELKEIRANDEERDLSVRLQKKALRLLPEFSPRDRR